MGYKMRYEIAVAIFSIVCVDIFTISLQGYVISMKHCYRKIIQYLHNTYYISTPIIKTHVFQKKKNTFSIVNNLFPKLSRKTG